MVKSEKKKPKDLILVFEDRKYIIVFKRFLTKKLGNYDLILFANGLMNHFFIVFLRKSLFLFVKLEKF